MNSRPRSSNRLNSTFEGGAPGITSVLFHRDTPDGGPIVLLPPITGAAPLGRIRWWLYTDRHGAGPAHIPHQSTSP